MKRITYIISDIDKALAFEWVATHIDRKTFKLSFILLNPGKSDLEDFLKSQNFPVQRIELVKYWGLLATFFKLWLTLFRSRPHIIHTHLRYASLLGITAGYFSGIRKRIHTRHNSSFHNIYHPHAVKTDKWVSLLSTNIVSISDVVTDVLVNWEHTNPKKITKIPHGFDLTMFESTDNLKIQQLRDKYIPDAKGPVIGMISRFIEWKGCIYGIQAFDLLLKTYPTAHLVLANASGPDADKVRQALLKLPKTSYTLIRFEPNIAGLYKLFDVFVHVPIDAHFEAFGQTYVEALASGIPSVFTHSGIAREFILDGYNALVVDYKRADQIEKSIVQILEDEKLRSTLVKNGKSSIQLFNLPTFINRLESLYND